MADFGDILTNITLTGGQAIRRNSGDSSFEAFIPLTDSSLEGYMSNTGDTASGAYNFDNNTFVIDSVNHRIGIKKANPLYDLDVNGIGRFNELLVDTINEYPASGNGVTIESVLIKDGEISLDYISPPSGNWSMNLANKQLRFLWVAPVTAAGAMELEVSGAFTGDVLHIHQHTGNPGAGSHLLHLEAEDPDICALFVDCAGTVSAEFTKAIKVDTINEYTADAGVTIEGTKMVDGNVGIGASTPLAKLHINGGTGSLSTGLAFGDGDTGFYESYDNGLLITAGGNNMILINQNTNVQFYKDIHATTAGYWMLRHVAPSSTTPNILPSRSDINTGIGHAEADQLSLIAGGVEGLRVTTTAALINTLNELTTDAGVTIEGVVIKDNTIESCTRYYVNLVGNDYIAGVSGEIYLSTNNQARLTIKDDEVVSGEHFRASTDSLQLGSSSIFWDTLFINSIYFEDINTGIYKDSSDNLTFTDDVTGTKTLADLVAGSGMVYPDEGIALSTGSAWDTSITDNSTDWNTAFGWGDHSGLYDDYSSWNLKVGGVQKTTVVSGGDLDIVGGTDITAIYSAGGVVTLAYSGSVGNVTKVGTPVNNELAVWTGNGTLKGTPDITYDGEFFRLSVDRVASPFITCANANTTSSAYLRAYTPAAGDIWIRVYGSTASGTTFGLDKASLSTISSNSTASGFLIYQSGAKSMYLATSTGIKVTIGSSAGIQFNGYGSGSITGTAAKWLAVDDSGNIIEEVAPVSGAPNYGNNGEMPYIDTGEFVYDSYLRWTAGQLVLGGGVSSNIPKYPLLLYSTNTSAVGGVGLGVGMQFRMENSAGGVYTNASIRSEWTDATSDAEYSKMVFGVMSDNDMYDRMSLFPDGQLKLHTYGSKTHIGTGAYALFVNSSGEVIEKEPIIADVDYSTTDYQSNTSETIAYTYTITNAEYESAVDGSKCYRITLGLAQGGGTSSITTVRIKLGSTTLATRVCTDAYSVDFQIIFTLTPVSSTTTMVTMEYIDSGGVSDYDMKGGGACVTHGTGANLVVTLQSNSGSGTTYLYQRIVEILQS